MTFAYIIREFGISTPISKSNGGFIFFLTLCFCPRDSKMKQPFALFVTPFSLED
jgi:hypothetical protein